MYNNIYDIKGCLVNFSRYYRFFTTSAAHRFERWALDEEIPGSIIGRTNLGIDLERLTNLEKMVLI